MIAAAHSYFDRGWSCIPLINDAEGRPKRPFSDGWQRTEHNWEVISQLPWDRALGLGIVLGPASNNLAVIDIDDVELAERVWSLCEASQISHYYVQTGRQRGHLYLRERISSMPRSMRIAYQGRNVSIELKAKGQQVAAPPTPGYLHRGATEPVEVHTVHEAWASLSSALGLAQQAPQGYSTAGYPRAWGEQVPEGERNNALFIEACRLKEAGMPIRSAIETLLARVKLAYQGAIDESELVRTVQSAYRRPTTPRGPIRGGVEV